MTNFQIINTSHPKYKVFKEEYKTVLESFKKFLIMKKMKKLDVTEIEVSVKGAPTEYPRFLLFALIQYSDIYNDNELDCELIEICNKVEKLMSLEGFEKFDSLKKHQRFYSSAINNFREFIDFQAELPIVLQETSYVYIGEDIVTEPVPRKEPIQTEKGLRFARNLAESMKAKQRANWKCELSDSHETFISHVNNKPYVEAHHLIPIAAQMNFEYTVDFSENIVVLCPNCHRKIHYGQKEEVKKMLDMSFEQKNHVYKNYGIDINILELYRYYKVKTDK